MQGLDVSEVRPAIAEYSLGTLPVDKRDRVRASVSRKRACAVTTSATR